jgi:hypothetical protein
MNPLNRRQFGSLLTGSAVAATLGSTLTRSLWAREVSQAAGDRYFYFALVADTHIIDKYYVPGGSTLPTPTGRSTTSWPRPATIQTPTC